MGRAFTYFNEHDPEKADALRHLMREGWIAPGEVDERDIRDVVPAELSGFAQCHFFAGIGLWSIAARRAGIPDDFPFWSGSCPCQPFSAAGAGDGVTDDRHLWPHWYWLIAQRRPDAVVGEQVATRDGLAWLDLVCADMEGSHYAGGALDLCSAGLGAPNIRQRLYMLWLDHEQCDGRGARRHDHAGHDGQQSDPDGHFGGVVNGIGEGLEGHTRYGNHSREPGRIGETPSRSVAKTGSAGGMAGTHGDGREPGRLPVRQWRPDEVSPIENGHGEAGAPASTPRPFAIRCAVRQTASGPELTGFSAETLTDQSCGRLNPAHSAWLQGIPAELANCVRMAMQSTSKSRRRSSKPSGRT